MVFQKLKWIFKLIDGQQYISSGYFHFVSYAFKLFLAVPMLLVYVIGAPLLAFFVLFKNRKNLDKPEIIKYILLLYQGLRHERYYWELVNTLRKCTLLGLQVFIPDSYTTVKALVGVLVLFICALMQARLNPFKISVISRLGKDKNVML